MDVTVLGMPLYAHENDQIRTAQPIAAVVIAKVLDEEGHVDYVTAATEGLKSVEALGMARYAQLKLEHGLTAAMDDDDE